MCISAVEEGMDANAGRMLTTSSSGLDAIRVKEGEADSPGVTIQDETTRLSVPPSTAADPNPLLREGQ